MSKITQTTPINCCGVAPKVYRRGKGKRGFHGIICLLCYEEVRASSRDAAVELWNGSMAMREAVTNADIEAAYQDELAAATERNGNMAVELAAMTQERDALRRENELKDKQIRLMSIRCAMYCTVSECCPKQPVDGKIDKETCYKCQTERSAKAAKVGKGEW